MRSQIARFLHGQRHRIEKMIDTGDRLSMPHAIVEFGRLISDQWELSGREYGQTFTADTSRPGNLIVTGVFSYPDFGQIWDHEELRYRWGIVHTHPDRPGQDALSVGDDIVLGHPEVKMVMVATRAGDGRHKVIARWETDDGWHENERFDLYPKPTFIAMFLAGILHLEPWALILADYDGDGKITIRDAWKAARERGLL